MTTATELLDVIEASHLVCTPRIQEDRAAVLRVVDACYENASIEPHNMAQAMAEALLRHGVVYGDFDAVFEVVEAYLQVVASADRLNAEEIDFLNSFLD